LREEINPLMSVMPLIDVKPENFNKFLNLGVKRKYQKGSYILDQGEIGQNIAFLNKGKIKILQLTENGEEKLFWYASEGTIIGDVPYFHAYPSNAAVIAQEDCELYIFDKSTINRILRDDPDFAEYLLEMMARKIRVLVSQIHDISFSNPVTRISKLLYLLSYRYGHQSIEGTELKLDITHKEIGSITCIHRVTVTNVISNLKKQGVLDKCANGHIAIKNMDELYNKAFGHSY